MMQSEVTTRQTDKIAIVDLKGAITVAGGTGLLRNTIKDLIAAGRNSVLLNLRDLTYMDSAGMGELVAACTTLRSLCGDLKLANPQERVANLLRMTKLSAIFEIFANERTALQSF
jgi:anti-sigma B factor antagonist